MEATPYKTIRDKLNVSIQVGTGNDFPVKPIRGKHDKLVRTDEQIENLFLADNDHDRPVGHVTFM